MGNEAGMINNRQKHVFIVTYGRSGSTVLQRLLQSMDGYFIRGENNNTLYALYLAYRRAYEARYSHGKIEHHATDPWYGANAIEPNSFARKLAKLFKDEILQPPEDARVVGFKEIRFHEAGVELFGPFLDFIAENFENSKFIFNMRRWQDVAKSSWWATMDPVRVQEIIEGADALYRSYAAKNPAISHLMRYENYVGQPEAFASLFDFLGEPFDVAKIEKLTEDRLDHARNVVGGPKEGRRTLKT